MSRIYMIDPVEVRIQREADSIFDNMDDPIREIREEDLARAFKIAWDNRDDETAGPLESAMRHVIEEYVRDDYQP